MTSPKPEGLQRTDLTRHFKACAPFLRHDTLQRVVHIVLAMVTARSVNHSDLCAHLPGASSIDVRVPQLRFQPICKSQRTSARLFQAGKFVRGPATK